MDAEAGRILAEVRRADEAFNRGDLEGYLAVYEAAALVMVEPGVAAAGRPALRRAMRAVMETGGQVTQLAHRVLVANDLALWVSRWRIDWRSPDGRPQHRESQGISIFRRDEGGRWRVALENPWGFDLPSAEAPRPGQHAVKGEAPADGHAGESAHPHGLPAHVGAHLETTPINTDTRSAT